MKQKNHILQILKSDRKKTDIYERQSLMVLWML